MNKKISVAIIFLTLILLTLALAGCKQQEVSVSPTCNKPYILVGTGCCLDTNDNLICDTDETKATPEQEPTKPEAIPETVEILKKNYSVELTVDSLIPTYNQETDKFSLLDISYAIKNKGDELDNLRFKFEIYQDGTKLVESPYIGILEKEKKLAADKILIDRQYIGLDSFPSIMGIHNWPMKVVVYLLNGEEVLVNQTRMYYIIYTTGQIPAGTYPEINKDKVLEIGSGIFYVGDVFGPPYSFDYTIVPQRFSADGKLEFTRQTKDDIITYTLKSYDDKVMDRDFVLDYYCEGYEISGIKFSYLIHDYNAFWDDLYVFKFSENKYTRIPDKINPGEKVTLEIGKWCKNEVLLLRKGTKYYVRVY
ncbi:MAG TPA: hypothetical protein HA362_05445 [Nanoarchaeota archaeon]|nr:hypothetical protein [Nanoarchaeota archaeon]